MRGLAATLVFATVSACDANQSPTGGDALFDGAVDPGPQDGQALCITTDAGDRTWTSLYQDFFGPTGNGQCGAATRTGANGTTSCHHDGTGNGALASGFICGDTQESCYEGITSPQAVFVGQPVVVPCNPSASYLTQVLRHDGAGIMPYYPETVVFSDDDMARVSGWISAGAPND
jgi:hypothetical protein